MDRRPVVRKDIYVFSYLLNLRHPPRRARLGNNTGQLSTVRYQWSEDRRWLSLYFCWCCRERTCSNCCSCRASSTTVEFLEKEIRRWRIQNLDVLNLSKVVSPVWTISTNSCLVIYSRKYASLSVQNHALLWRPYWLGTLRYYAHDRRLALN